MRDRLDCEGINIVQSSEPVAMQTVFHTHVHVIPRYSDDGLQAARRIRQPADHDELASSRRSSVPKVRYERDGDVGLVVLDDPPLNLFGAELTNDLVAALEEAEGDMPRALVVRAEGTRVHRRRRRAGVADLSREEGAALAIRN